MKITKQYLQKVIKEELTVALGETESLEQEGKAAAGLAAGLALFAGWAGLSVKDRIDRIQKVLEVARTEYRDIGYDKLAEIYQDSTGKTPEEDRMDIQDLRIFAAGQKIQ